MSDLRDQMLKLGLITEAQASAAVAPEGPRTGRGRRNSRGPRDRGETRRISRPDPDAEVTPEASAEAARVATEARIEIKAQRGGRRWYYVGRDGVVPSVDLGDDVADKLTRGDLALVESPDGDAWLVPREAAIRIVALDPAWLRTFAG